MSEMSAEFYSYFMPRVLANWVPPSSTTVDANDYLKWRITPPSSSAVDANDYLKTWRIDPFVHDCSGILDAFCQVSSRETPRPHDIEVSDELDEYLDSLGGVNA